MKNVFERFSLDRNTRFWCNEPVKWLSYRLGWFHPCYSFTKPIKDGKLTKYAKVLVSAYVNKENIYTKNALRVLGCTGWQTIRYSGLVYEYERGEYALTVDGKDYCELICEELVKANL